MIPPRLRQKLIAMFIHDHIVGTRKIRSVFWTEKCTTNETQIAPKDLRFLEQKGLLTFELSKMTDLFDGIRFWDARITEAGKEELAEEFERRQAEAERQNRAPEPA